MKDLTQEKKTIITPKAWYFAVYTHEYLLKKLRAIFLVWLELFYFVLAKYHGVNDYYHYDFAT